MKKQKIKIIFFHGLLSKGKNGEDLLHRLKTWGIEEGYDVQTELCEYPKLRVLMGWTKWARNIVRDYMLKDLQLEFAPDRYTIVLCHSNATWAGSRAVAKYFNVLTPKPAKPIKIDKLILFGSTIKREWDWGLYPIKSVVNFIGSRDKVVWLSKLYKMGWSGQKGFKKMSLNLKQIKTDWDHHGFVEEDNFDLIKNEVFRDV